MLYVQHGRVCVKRGNRFIAVAKPVTLTDRIASDSASGLRRNAWARIDVQVGRAYVVNNATGRAAPRRQPRFGA